MPRNATAAKPLESGELPVGQPKPRIMRSDGDAKDSLEPSVVEKVDKPIDQEWADNMIFNAQKVTFVVNESTDPNADNPVICGNDGDSRQFWRGTEYTEERRFLESLMRAKITSFTQKKVTDNQGIESFKHIPRTACRYDVRVINDPHPMGGEWLKSIRLQP